MPRKQSNTEKAVRAYVLQLYAERKPRSVVIAKDGAVRVFVERLPGDESRCGRVFVGMYEELARIVETKPLVS